MSIASATQETTESLIKPANVQEQVLAKVSRFRKENTKATKEMQLTTGREQAKLNLVRSFGYLSSCYFGAKKRQILEMSDSEIEALFLLVLKQATKTHFRWKVFYWCVPIVGWLAAFIRPVYSETYTLVHSVCRLKENLGDSFDPVEIIRDGKSDLDWL